MGHVTFNAPSEIEALAVKVPAVKTAIVALLDRERRSLIGCELQPITIDLSVFVELEIARVEVGMNLRLACYEFVVEVV